MVSMFNANPEFVADFIAEVLKKGGEETERELERWKRFIP